MSDKTQFVHVILLDESSSMLSMRDATISGFNENIDQIQADSEENPDTQDHRVCLVTFNGHVDVPIWLENVNDISHIDTNAYSPNGMTSLRDAISQTISELRRDLKEEIEDGEINILMTILSDGQDTSSREATPEAIKSLIEDLGLENDDSPWTLTYIGASEACLTEVQSFGISAVNTSAFDANAAGTRAAMGNLSSARSTYTNAISNHGLSKSMAQSLYNESNVTGMAMTNEEIEKWKIDHNIDTD